MKMLENMKAFRILRSVCHEVYESCCFYKYECLMRAIIFWGALTVLCIEKWFSFGTSLFIAFFMYICFGGWIFMLLLYHTLFRDVRGLYRLIKMRLFIRRCWKVNFTVGQVFHSLVEKHPNKLCFVQDDKKWTFREFEDYCNQVANCFAELGYRRGDDVAIFMESCPEFVAIWLGLSKIGVVPALINSNLRLLPLAHSITVINCKAVIFGCQLSAAVKEVAPLLKETTGLQYFCLGDFDPVDFPARSMHLMLQESSCNPPPTQDKGNMEDRLFYVYTSGTTGLPKAAIITHSRFMQLGAGIHYMIKISPDDVVYTALPLYHTAGGILSMSQTLLFGSTLAIRNKFSASRFWDDVINYEATVAQYIGEICRYLLNQPVKPQETQHKIRLMFGNGLRPQIWTQFTQRFGIENIGELYGSTEGNANVINIDNKVGSVGFMSRIIPSIYPVSLIKVEPSTGEPIRDRKGLCIRCEPGEPGEFVGKIINNDPLRSFDGYVSQSATKKKIVRDCFRKGDMAFLSGDLLTMDENGYLFFMDRTGDTFRWRGENVSTTEVEGIVSKILGLADTVVFGVEVPGVEGKAGMAAIHDPDKVIDLEYLSAEVKRALPSYAVPLFVRVCETLETTGTYKLKKVDLQKEGFNPNIVTDPVYFLDKKQGNYVQLNSKIYDDICLGKIQI